MAQSQTASFQGQSVVGVDFPLAKGTKPSVGRIRIPQVEGITAETGDLVLQSGTDTVTFADAVPDINTLRYLNRDGKREWSMEIRDRRARWPSKRISGHYNRRWRDGTIDASTKLSASELADAALAAVGEPGGTTLPEAYPEMVWDNTPVNEALDQLVAVLPVHVVRTKFDFYSVYQTGLGENVDDHFPATPAITPNFPATVDGGPKTIRAVCGKTWFNCRLQLEAVGRDTDGEYKLIDALSYRPSWGWEKEWPTLFSGVQQWQRPFAFMSVFRCYRVVVPQTLPFNDADGNPIVIQSLDDLDLDEFRMVPGIDAEAPLSLVHGTWYPLTDHYYNTHNCLVYGNEHWRFDKKHRMIVFDYPVWAAGNCVSHPELFLHTSFHVRNSETKDWYRHEQTVERNDGHGEWTVDLPFLWKAQGQYFKDCQVIETFDNETDVETETQTYLDAWKDHWDDVKNKKDVAFTGTRNIDLSGNISRIRYRIGRGLTPETRVSQHYIPKV